MTFLPKDYEMPKNGNGHYLKFDEGENTFRVLSDAIVGWVYWQDDQGNVLDSPIKGCKAIHVKSVEEIPEATLQSPNLQLKHFWAFVVWDYRDQAVQILKVTQNSIMEAMEQYAQSAKWGDPKGYDFIIHKNGEGLETRYQVTVNPKEPLDEGIVKMYEDMKIDLAAYFRGEDPFKQAEKENGASVKAAAASH